MQIDAWRKKDDEYVELRCCQEYHKQLGYGKGGKYNIILVSMTVWTSVIAFYYTIRPSDVLPSKNSCSWSSITPLEAPLFQLWYQTWSMSCPTCMSRVLAGSRAPRKLRMERNNCVHFVNYSSYRSALISYVHKFTSQSVVRFYRCNAFQPLPAWSPQDAYPWGSVLAE